MFHIVDVDNTLVFTDELNTAGYVHALACTALEPRKVVPRITREIVQEWYPQLSEYDLVHIATLKQSYVESHLDMSQLNSSVARVLSTYGSERCALWTAANPERIRMLLRHHMVTDYRAIRFSNKTENDISHAVQDFCVLFDCEPEELCFHEDNPEVINHLRKLGMTVMAVEVKAETVA